MHPTYKKLNNMGVRSRMGVVSIKRVMPSLPCRPTNVKGMHVEEDKCGGNGLDTNGVLAQDQFKSLVEGKYNYNNQ